MADATPTPALHSTADTKPYVPVSWMAVAADTAAGTFLTLLIFFGASAAFKDHKPLIMPSLLILAVMGVVLSFAARRMIRNSEGTRTGEKMASAAWWTCVIGGLGYSTYLFAIEYSIRREAEAELRQWVGNILQDDKESFDKAFVRMIEPSRRGNIAIPTLIAQAQDRYLAFGQLDIVRIAKRNPGACKLEDVALKDWMYRGGNIECVFSAVLKCPEGSLPIEIPLQGAEAKPGMESVGRQWSILPTPGVIVQNKATFTPYAWRIKNLEMSGMDFGQKFIKFLGSGPEAMPFAYHVFMQEKPNLKYWEDFAKTLHARTALAGGQLSVFPITADYSEYLQKHLLKLADGREPSTEQKQRFLAIWNTLGVMPPGKRLMGNDKIESNVSLTVTPSGVEVRVPCEIPSVGASGDLAAARGRLVIICTEPDVIAEVTRLRNEANPDHGTTNPPEEIRRRDFQWRVVRIESDLHEVKNAPPQTPGGPGAQGGPGPQMP